MKQIAVLVFDEPEGQEYDIGYVSTEDKAIEAFKEIEELAKKDQLKVESGTIVVKNNEGVVKLRKTSEMTAGRGAARGGFWGLLVGLIFAGPVVGLLAGLGLGAILGGRATKGIDRDFIKQIGNRMRPGNAALFLLIPGDDEPTLKHLDAYEGPLYTTLLTNDVEEALEQASKQEDVLEAIKFDELG